MLRRITHHEHLGPIYKLRIGGNDRLILTSRELVNKVCNCKEFVKYAVGFLWRVRDIVVGGLFSAYPGQESWRVTHSILLPGFGSVRISSSWQTVCLH